MIPGSVLTSTPSATSGSNPNTASSVSPTAAPMMIPGSVLTSTPSATSGSNPSTVAGVMN